MIQDCKLVIYLFQLPSDICSSQQINYTVFVENDVEENNSIGNISVTEPLTVNYTGTGVVSHQISGQFEVNQTYSVWVEVGSLAGNSVSRRYHFGKGERLQHSLKTNDTLLFVFI